MGNSNGKPVIFTDQVNLNHFRLLRVVGKGAFGKVRIVERKDTGCTFALKYIRKDEVVRSESVRNIIRERRMLESLNHPFLCNLRYSFQDIEYLYLVVDLMTGGDLRFHISRKAFTEDAVRFWMAELGCALRYIHSQGIVHRDLKPDNVLLDADGHVHLADFNVASDFKPDKPLTSKSGTLAYLAPEVYEGKGYSCEVDWWSLGVTFYECIYNKRPFEANSHDQLAHRIKKADPPFPLTNPPVSNPCLHAISSLLEPDRTQRIGAIGFDTYSDNPFFRPIDFEALERKEIDPIFIPSSEKTNFDATYDLEELLLEEAPLEARARRQKPREQLKEDASTAEIRADELHRMIEKLFEPFDYTLVHDFNSRSSDNSEITSAPSAASTLVGFNTSPTEFTSHARPYHPSGVSHQPLFISPSTARAIDVDRGYGTYPRVRSGNVTATQSPNGSPPVPAMDLSPGGRQFDPRSNHNGYFSDTGSQIHDQRGRSQSHSRSTSKSRRKFSRSKRTNTLLSGGDRTGSGSPEPMDIADPGGLLSGPTGPPPMPALPAPPPPPQLGTLGVEDGDKRPSGMLAFLSRKRGRDKSPKARERGVLGKEGARAIVPQ